MKGLPTGVALNASGMILARFFLYQDWARAVSAINLPPVSPNLVYLHLAMRFAIGFSLVWLFVVMRPFCRSPATASLMAALSVWFLAYLLGLLEIMSLGIYPAHLVIITLIWGFAELVVASLLAAWLYCR